jgi:hypothetical protein
MAGSLNINYSPSDITSISGSYSTFQSFSNLKSQFLTIDPTTPYENIDTLKFTQITSSASLTVTHTFGKNEKWKQSLSFNVAYQQASDQQGDVEQTAGMKFYNLNAAYSLNLVAHQIVLAAALNATINDGTVPSKTIGPNVAVNKALFDKKLRCSLSSSYNRSYSEREKTSTIINVRLNASLALQKKHYITISAATVRRSTNDVDVSRAYTEYTGALGYTYTFAMK